MNMSQQRARSRLAAGAAALVGLAALPAHAQLSEADLAALQEQAREQGWTFAIGYNEATTYPLNQLAGVVVPADWEKLGPWERFQIRDDLPPAFDWRDYNGVTPIRNQGGCGSCWAFSAAAAVESKLLIAEGWNLDLSEQWLVSCTAAGSCNGGWHTNALSYMKGNAHSVDLCGDSGAVLEADMPYEAWNKPCGCPYDHPYHIDGWAYVGPQWGTPTVDEMKQAMYEHGPLSVCVAVDSSFQAYNGGVFNSCGATSINHAVVLVGWDDTMGSDGVWIMRNSWGAGWGEGGYMYIEYGCARIGYAAVYTRYTPPPPSGMDHACGETPIELSAVLDDQALNFAQTFDLEAVVSLDDDWTSTDVTVSVDGEFYQHGQFDASTPQPQLWQSYPALAFDSFFSARDWATPGFALGPNVTNDSMSATWFDTLNSGNGTYTIGRFTVVSGTTLTMTGTSTARNTMGELIPFDYTMQVQIPVDCVGDFNGDGLRDQADLGTLLASYGIDDGGDIDEDGDTDQADLGALLTIYNVPCN
jgi:C1A family cysteine protease